MVEMVRPDKDGHFGAVVGCECGWGWQQEVERDMLLCESLVETWCWMGIWQLDL
jgi:hypothetical protein